MTTFDDLFLKVNADYLEYHWYIDHATRDLEENMTEEEIEIQDKKMILSPSKIGRFRSYHELTWEEANELSKHSKEIMIKLSKQIIR